MVMMSGGHGAVTPEQLARWGVQLPADAGHPFRGILYQDPRCAARAAFPAGQGLGRRRLRLHEALHRRAAELGVELCWKTEVRELEPLSTLSGYPRD